MTAEEHGYYLEAVVKGFDGTFAVLETADVQTVMWPIKQLPDDISIGMSVRLLVSTEQSDEIEREKLAREVINSLLRS